MPSPNPKPFVASMPALPLQPTPLPSSHYVSAQTAQAICQAFKTLGIAYRRTNHPPVVSVKKAQQYTAHIAGAHTKNLFLRNKKASQHYLVMVPDHHRVNLKSLRTLLAENSLSFASAQHLEHLLGLYPGGVSPLGLVCDTQQQVQLLVDKTLWEHEEINMHPETNSATLTLTRDELHRFLNHYSPCFRSITMP